MIYHKRWLHTITVRDGLQLFFIEVAQRQHSEQITTQVLGCKHRPQPMRQPSYAFSCDIAYIILGRGRRVDDGFIHLTVAFIVIIYTEQKPVENSSHRANLNYYREHRTIADFLFFCYWNRFMVTGYFLLFRFCRNSRYGRNGS